MIEDKPFLTFNSPGSTIKMLEAAWDNTETYTDHVDLLRRLLLFIYDKASEGSGKEEFGLWDITDKEVDKLERRLDKVDKLLLKVRGKN